MRLTSHLLRIWADDHHIADLTLVDLDYFYYAGMIFQYPAFRANVEEKLRLSGRTTFVCLRAHRPASDVRQ